VKTYLLLATCLVCAGCINYAPNTRDLQVQLDSIKTELAAIQVSTQPATNHTSMRWATANKQDINMAVMQWRGNKARERREAWVNTLPPDVQEKLRTYESLQSKFMQMQMAMNNSRMFAHRPQPPNFSMTPPSESDFLAMSNRVEEARAPIAGILEHRDQMQAGYRDDDDTVEQLVAEYVQDRYDLVVDSGYQNRNILFRTGSDVPDITESVIKLFKEKARSGGLPSE
jgi:hypothetical protein